jgi:hypothetical protein
VVAVVAAEAVSPEQAEVEVLAEVLVVAPMGEVVEVLDKQVEMEVAVDVVATAAEAVEEYYQEV